MKRQSLKEFIQSDFPIGDSSDQRNFLRITAACFDSTLINSYMQEDYTQSRILVSRYNEKYSLSGLVFDIVRLYNGLQFINYDIYKDDYKFLCDWFGVEPENYLDHCKFDLKLDKLVEESLNLSISSDYIFTILETLVNE